MVQEKVATNPDQEAVITIPKTDTEIDIIVPSHNKGSFGLELTMGCIKHLYNYTKHPFHLIVVDDSNDITPLWLTGLQKEKSNVTYVHSDTPYTSGNQVFNIGLAHCNNEFVATVMNSMTVQPDWELVAIELLKRNPKIATIGLKCLFPWGTIESAGIALVEGMNWGGVQVAGIYPTDIGANFPSHLLCNIYERDAVQWAFAMHRREAIQGNLAENVYHGFLGWDDIDNCYVLRQKGWKVFYCGMGSGYHLPRATRGVENEDAEKIRLNYENGDIFRKRWGLKSGKVQQPASPVTGFEWKEVKPEDNPPMNRAERRRAKK